MGWCRCRRRGRRRDLSPVAGESHQRCCQRFPQGRAHVPGAVAPLVQALAGGVQIQRGHILDDGKLDLIPAAGFRQRLQAVFFSQPSGRSLFHNGLTGGNGMELGIERIAFHGELTVAGDEIFPRQGGVPPVKSDPS